MSERLPPQVLEFLKFLWDHLPVVPSEEIPAHLRGALAWCIKQDSQWARTIGIDNRPYVELLPDGISRLEEERLWDSPLQNHARNGERQQNGPASDDLPAGIAPRDAWIVEQYKAHGTDTYHKPAKIYAKWGGMTATERAAICPDSPNKIAKGTIEKIIKKAKREP
jgi:hypothetical protein